MFHKVNPPSSLCQLNKIVEFQHKVVIFVCIVLPAELLTESLVKRELGDEIGEWFYNKLWTRRNGCRVKTQLNKGLERIVRYLQRHPTMCTFIVDAFEHDIQFHNYFDDGSFTFQYNSKLSATAQKVIRSFLSRFYTDLLSTGGFPSCIHGNPTSFDRDKFIKSFWDSNKGIRVCPACDRPHSIKVGNKIYSDADHFFPKSKYPFLSIHPYNLLPLCLDCNRILKGNKDPIDYHNNQPLINTFHPYIRPAKDYVNVITYRDNKGVYLISLNDKDGMPSRRVSSLNRVFKLEKHWISNLDYSIDFIGNSISELGYLNTQQKEQMKLQDFKKFLQRKLQNCLDKRGVFHYNITISSYLSYVISNPKELESLYNKYIKVCSISSN